MAYTALDTVDSFKRQYPELIEGLADTDMDIDLIVQQNLEEATGNIEDRCSRRLVPFYNHIYDDRLSGLDPFDGGGFGTPQVLMDEISTLGMDRARSLSGGDAMTRHLWLDEYAPRNPELWTYDIKVFLIQNTYGGWIDVLPQGVVAPPNVTDGHVWLKIGTFAPEGSRVHVEYDGGYTKGVPPALQRACRMQAALFTVLDNEPQLRGALSVEPLAAQIDRLIAPWVKG